MNSALGVVVQIAYLVDDVHAAAADWARRFGAGPFFVRRHLPLASAEHGGLPASFDHSSAYGQWGAVQVELVQLHEAHPVQLAEAVAATGLHHVACFVASLADEQARLEALGWPAVLTARTAGGQAFAFHDARADLGHLLEVYEPTERVLGLYERVSAAARGWDGRAPVRSL
jgi:hypothetical protein